ncbi:MAG TPA: glycosyltransferase family 4 protein, partial [Terrimicrobiaceae bacterium]|nr:glycosyltransferase family 4 protein [Terrimicrobiaceae bacterium]
DLLLKAFARYKGPLKLVICGGATYERAHDRLLRKLADDRVIFTGPRYGDGYLELSRNALFFVMPADIEATRLVLLDQMGMGAAIVYKDCPATREVVGEAGVAFSPENAEESLAERISFLAENPEHCRMLGERALERAREKFDWDPVVDQYETLFAELAVRCEDPGSTRSAR